MTSHSPQEGPYWVDSCHGMVGGPAVIGPTGIVGFMQGTANDAKAEDLCRRLNAAWKELGGTIDGLRAQVVALAAARDEAQAENEDHRKSMFMPGSYECVVCNFSVQKMLMEAKTGEVGHDARQRPREVETCPNGCGPLIAVTWERAFRQTLKMAEDALARVAKAEGR